MIRAACVMVMLATCPLIATAATGDAPKTPASAEEGPVSTSSLIHSGFVLYDGQYLPPPYIFALRDGALSLNDRPLSADAVSSLYREDQGPDDPGRGRREPRRGRTGRRGSEQLSVTLPLLEDQLQHNWLLMIFTDKDGSGNTGARIVPPHLAATILGILRARTNAETKLLALQEQGASWVTVQQWATVVERFMPNADVGGRVDAFVGEYEEVWKENDASQERVRWYTILHAQTVTYGITVTVLFLAVIAMGNLLSYRPDATGGWRDIGSSNTLVVRHVILLAVLATVDLLLTFAVQQTGGLTELKPWGSQLIASPALLAVFKLSALLLACLALLSLRRYRGAQVVAWWMCLACTVVAFRWLTFNSLVFA